MTIGPLASGGSLVRTSAKTPVRPLFMRLNSKFIEVPVGAGNAWRAGEHWQFLRRTDPQLVLQCPLE
jgi:hypothetical protein